MKRVLLITLSLLALGAGGYWAYCQFVAPPLSEEEVADEALVSVAEDDEAASPEESEEEREDSDVEDKSDDGKKPAGLNVKVFNRFEKQALGLTEHRTFEFPGIGRGIADLYLRPVDDRSYLTVSNPLSDGDERRAIEVSLMVNHWHPLAYGNRGEAIQYLDIQLSATGEDGAIVASSALLPTRSVMRAHMGTLLLPEGKYTFDIAISPQPLLGSTNDNGTQPASKPEPALLAFAIDTENLVTQNIDMDVTRLNDLHLLTIPGRRVGTTVIPEIKLYMYFSIQGRRVEMKGYINNRGTGQGIDIIGNGQIQGNLVSIRLGTRLPWDKLQFLLNSDMEQMPARLGVYSAETMALKNWKLGRLTPVRYTPIREAIAIPGARYRVVDRDPAVSSFAYLSRDSDNRYALRWYRYRSDLLQEILSGTGQVDHGLLTLNLVNLNGQPVEAQTFLSDDLSILRLRIKRNNTRLWEVSDLIRSDQWVDVELKSIAKMWPSGHYEAAHPERATFQPQFDLEVVGPYVLLRGSIRADENFVIDNISGSAVSQKNHLVVEWTSSSGNGITEFTFQPGDASGKAVARIRAPLASAQWTTVELVRTGDPQRPPADYAAMENGTWHYTVSSEEQGFKRFTLSVVKSDNGISVTSSRHSGSPNISSDPKVLRAVWLGEGGKAPMVLELFDFTPQATQLSGRLREDASDPASWHKVVLDVRSP